MKTTSKIIYFALFSIISVSLNAQKSVSIKNEKITSSVVSKWIKEYTKENGSDLKVEELAKNASKADIELVLAEQPDSLLDGKQVIYVLEYALLPVVSKNYADIESLDKEKFNKKKLKEIFFEKDILSEDGDRPSKLSKKFTVYSGNRKDSGANVFASHFGYSTSSLRGKKIAGDDIFLLNAISKDNTGVTFNSLSYLYDLSTRELKADIKLLPLDVKKEHRQILESATIDEVIALVENEDIDLIPTQKIGLVINNSANVKPEVQNFVKWVLTEGQKYSHDYGFLRLNKDDQLAQVKVVETQFLSLNK